MSHVILTDRPHLKYIYIKYHSFDRLHTLVGLSKYLFHTNFWPIWISREFSCHLSPWKDLLRFRDKNIFFSYRLWVQKKYQNWNHFVGRKVLMAANTWIKICSDCSYSIYTEYASDSHKHRNLVKGEHLAGVHGHKLSLKPCGKPTIGTSSEFRVLVMIIFGT